MGGGRAARIRQGMADVKVLKGLLAHEARSQFISAVKPSSQLLFFYCAASLVTSDVLASSVFRPAVVCARRKPELRLLRQRRIILFSGFTMEPTMPQS